MTKWVLYNNKRKFVSSNAWNVYLKDYYYNDLIKSCDKLQIELNKNKYYFNPLECNIGNPNWKHCKIRQLHRMLFQIIREYSTNASHYDDYDLCRRALSNVWIDSDNQDGNNNNFTNIQQLIMNGTLSFKARAFTNISISRGTPDDCTITSNDFLWVYKRFQQNMDIAHHRVVKIVQVMIIFSSISLIFHSYLYKVYIYISLHTLHSYFFCFVVFVLFANITTNRLDNL
jgi:hypothetical protein